MNGFGYRKCRMSGFGRAPGDSLYFARIRQLFHVFRPLCIGGRADVHSNDLRGLPASATGADRHVDHRRRGDDDRLRAVRGRLLFDMSMQPD